MNAFKRHLAAASGYLELELAQEANAELDEIEPEQRADWRVLGLRVGVYQQLAAWELLCETARHLSTNRPEEPQWIIALAYATRRSLGLQEALAVLAQVADRFPDEPIIRYNLACYAAQLGHLHSARARLVEAITLTPKCRDIALKDEDLKPLWDELREGRL
jgi:hypothetical protein